MPIIHSKPRTLSRFLQGLGSISGLTQGQNLFLWSIRPLGKAVTQMQLPSSKRQEKSIPDTVSFAELAKHWGIITPKDAETFCRIQKYSACAGLALFALGVAYFFRNEPQGPLPALLRCALALCASFSGALLSAGSLWRLHCLKHARVIPFRLWLRRR